ncbi:MAG: LysR family transcriptional regulator [Sphingomonadaceae bacterium]|nr:LysR family transcriptional regulator [Sphingomonadaceae bacterium]
MDAQGLPAYLQAMAKDMIDWDDFRIFLAVARAGQIAGAGAALGIDATTVGRRLRRLEKALGQVLFEQQRDRQRLTEAGEHLLERAEGVERLMREAGGEARTSGAPGGLVRVSASEGFGTWLVAHHLPEFATSFPDIRVDLVASSGLLNPSKRETDIAILLARPRRGPLVTRKLTDYGLRLYAARTYLAGRPAVRTAADLPNHRLIGYIPDFVYAPELDYLDEISPGLAPGLRSSSINAQYRMAAAGAGIAVLPCFIGDSEPRLARVLPALRLQRSFWLVTHEDTRHFERIRRFGDWLLGVVRERQGLLAGE